MIDVPFLDLGAGYRELQEQLEPALLESLRSGWYIGGQDVEDFESDFASFTETKYCLGLGNGLDALRLALLAMEVGTGDEVIVPSNTFIATWLAVSQCGAIPVPVEPSEETYTIDPSKIEQAITSRTKVIIPVHLYGHPADLDAILTIARTYGLRVLEDAAQAHGARYKGRRIGGHGDAVAWSFYPGKNLGALGDAGAVSTNDAVIADRIRILRNYGSRAKYIHEVQGVNSRLDPVQAIALRVKLQRLDEWNLRRARVAARYNAMLGDTQLKLPSAASDVEPVWHVYAIQHPERDFFQEQLRKTGIGTVIHYPTPPHLQAAYSGTGFVEGQFPIAERMAKRLLSLPMGPHLSNEQLETVVRLIHQIDKQ